MKTEKTEKTEMEYRAALGIKIEAMAKGIGALAKDGTNTFSNYSYISNEQLVAAMRQKLGEHMLSISTDVLDYEERESIDAKGKQVIRTIVKMSFQIVDLETGYMELRQFMGAEQDSGGKSFSQAITQCTKYFYFKLFKVTSKDEQDPDGNTNQAARAGARAGAGAGGAQPQDDRAWLNPDDKRWSEVVKWLAAGNDFAKIYQKFKLSKENAEKLKKDGEEQARVNIENNFLADEFKAESDNN